MRRLVTALAIGGAILVNAGGMNPLNAHATQARFQPRLGRFLGIVPTRSQFATLPCTPAGSLFGLASCTGTLYYNGGPVMTTNKVYTIFWIPPGYSVSHNYVSLINRYFHDVSADQGKNTNVYDVQTQYSQQMGGGAPSYIQNNTTFQGTAIDNNALPPLDPVNCPDALSASNGGTNAPSTTSGCVTDGQLHQEISNVIQANHWPVDNNTEFFMFTAQNIGTCFSPAVGAGQGPVATSVNAPLCSFQYFCAYHSYYFDSTVNPNSQIIYANMPYAAETNGNPLTCDFGNYPNGDPADATINVASHEHIESITDPFGTGWWDSNPNDGTAGNEIGDMCDFNFGTLYGPTGAQWSQTINGDHYVMQQEWDNTTNTCAQTERPSFTLTPNIGYPSAPFKIDGPQMNGTQMSLQFLPANTTVNFTFTSAGSSTAEALGSVTSDASGHAAKFMTHVPADALAGTATVTASPVDGSQSGTQTFTVPSP